MNKILIFILGLLSGLLAAGLILLVSGPPRGEAILLPLAPSPAPLLVYVTGEVNQPGTYSLPQGSRVDDAVAAAGGFTSRADISAANLAASIKDGQQIHFPAEIKYETPQAGRSSPVGLVYVNTATLDELIELPGIGEVTARAILDYRQRYGPFEEVEDLLLVDGIGPATLEEIKPFILVQ